MPEPVSVVVPGVHFEMTAEIIALPESVRARKRAMFVNAPLRDFLVPLQAMATG